MRNMRSQDIADISGVRFHIVGCGAIGSSVATQLARLGADNFTLYDYDKVGIENVGVSQYVYQAICKTKIEAFDYSTYKEKGSFAGVSDKALDNALLDIR